MKRILTIAVLFFSFMFVMAQTPNNHLTFKGIPITGTVENFAQELEAKGVRKIRSGSFYVAFEGEFAGYSDSEIYVSRDLDRNIVYRVVVVFPKKSSWARLEEEYNKFKDMLTNKYGKPASHSETFKKRASTFSDAAKMRSLKAGNCDYEAEWKVDNGTITVDIFSLSETDGGYVRLIYFDKINDALADKAIEDDL